ncbi:MAG TPA: GGDEF domain-containing protein [Pseudonocardiaceae bacterium]|jgi:diguanylate cyclase (GGDEF)-like protein|nr:GGDEF domain-containing protein [Pseudonocardiaceae bacterium]
MCYVLLIDAIGIATAIGIRRPVTHLELTRFAVLVVAAIAYIEFTRGVERVREVNAKAGPYMDTESVWCFAAVVILSPGLACALVAIIFTWSWFRVWRGRRPLYRWIFSGATVLIATEIAAAILAAGPGPHPGMPSTLVGLGVAAAAAAVRWLVNYALVIGAILMSAPNIRGAQVLANIDERVMEVGAFGLGLVAAGVLVFNPLLLLGIVAGLVAMHRGILLNQYRKAARTDSTTDLNAVGWWRQIAEQALDRATASGGSLCVLILDLDHFKQVNDTYGHVAGDQVLRCVGQALRAEIRAQDSPGRWGGEEFVVALSGVGLTELAAIAERIRRRIHTLTVPVDSTRGPATVGDLTVSIGGARYPGTGAATLTELVLAADAALYQAKDNGRNQVCLSPVRALDTEAPQVDLPEQRTEQAAPAAEQRQDQHRQAG